MNNNKDRLRVLMADANLDTLAITQLLEQKTKRKYSIRTVQAWVANQSKASSRECPEWVIENLEQVIKGI